MAAAAAKPTKNLDQRLLKLRTSEVETTVQVAGVRKPLASTAKLHDAGNDVSLHTGQPHILHKATSERIALTCVGKAYTADGQRRGQSHESYGAPFCNRRP